jgi:DNA adenine methylase
MTVSRPAVRYYGGKWRIAQWILDQFPDHHCYVETHGGAASVLLRKEAAPVEVLNDIDGEVVNFFQVLRGRTDELIRAIELTPYARDEERLAFEPSDDPLERARRLYVRGWQTYGGPRTQWRSGWRFQYQLVNQASVLKTWNNVRPLEAIAERLKQVLIESDDALSVIERFDSPDTLFYVDPPYLMSTRSERWRKNGYQHEMTDEQHMELAAALRMIRGMAIVSAYQCPEYDRWYAGWRRVSTGNQNAAAQAVTESLYISPRAADRARQLSMSMEVAP